MKNGTIPTRSSRLPVVAMLAVALLQARSYLPQASGEEQPKTPEVRFRHIVVDAAEPADPWLKTVGDLNGDGRADLIVGGHSGGGLVWYENPVWKKHVIDPDGHFGTDAEVADVDHDGKPDIICITDNELRWYRNPDWKMFVIDRRVLHDIEVADFDGDGKIGIVGRNQGEFGQRGDRLHFYKQKSPTEWSHRELEIPNGEGLCVADIDADGKPDIVIETLWFRNPGDLFHGQLQRHNYTKSWTYHNTFVAVGDINGDGRPDIVLAPSELKGGKYRISWFEAPADPKHKDWTEHIVENDVETVQHFVGVADINLDGTLDIVSAAMHQGTPPQEVKVYFNQGKGASWRKQVIATTGSHSMRLVDLHNDGRISLFGANHQGQKIELWESLLPITRPRSAPTNR
jgi:hypothetical protein